MPRIDPQQLLKCLSVLLSPNGGIKSQDEVQRLASLMTKFSKKLVSKCIYVSILKATETHLLVMFMSAGGWDLTYTWLSDGVTSKNWPLVKELVDLLLMCPVDIDRLKTNACPKLIKTLSKDPSAEENVRLLACKLVEQWLRIVRGDSDCSDKSTSTLPSVTNQPLSTYSSGVPTQSITPCNSTDPTIKDPDDNNLNSDNNSGGEIKVENDSLEGTGDETGNLPVYKITIRDGNKVLAEISGDRRSSTEGPEEDCSTGTEDIIQDDEEHVEDESEDEDLIKPVKLNKKPAGKSKKQNATKLPSKLHSNIKKERDSTDSSSSDKTSNRKKDSVKQPIKKKVDNAKSKAEVKNKGNSIVKDPVLNKDREESTTLKPRGKFSLTLKNRKNIFSKEKESKPDKIELREKNNFEDSGDSLTDKEKETLSKFITPPISKVGKIPKKSNLIKEDKNIDIKSRSPKEEKETSKTDIKKNIETKRPEIKRLEKKYSISVEPKKTVQSDRPKTVKTFNSKFRSTGLEEDVKPPPPRTSIPKKLTPPVTPSLSDKKLGKRSSPPPDNHLPEKRPKPESPQEDKKSMEKIGGIKLIPPKPKPMFLQESDVFMDAMLAANTMKEPRKRKRRGSTSKDSSQSDPKKEATGSPMHSPRSEDASPSCVKPTFKFYQDTLDTSTEEDRSNSKMDESLEFAEPDQNPEDDQKSISSEDDKPSVKVEGPNGPVKGVLVHLKSKRQKKSVSWKEDGLECIKYFELDETERVNVTKNFADMKNMEREHERENFQIARKLSVDDVMEERMRWKALIPIDIAATIVAPGKNSQEKDIQYAREKTTPAAIYFNKRAIPEAPGEPDLEIHATTDPTCIPLDDITGSTDSINDFTSTPWPEPRGQPPPPPPPVQPPVGPFQPPPGPGSGPVPGPVPFPQGPFPPMGPFMPGPPGSGMPMPPAGDCWRTGDGKVLPMPPEMMMPPQGMMPPGMPGMPPGPMMMPPGVPPDMPFPMMPGPGPNPTPEEMAQFAGGFPPMGPAPPQMFGPGPPGPPPPGPQSGNWQGGGGGGGWYQESDQGPPPGSGPGRYQGNNWRGGRGGNRNPDNWNTGGNSRTPICNNFLKRGFCRNNSCRFRHPRN